MMQHVYLRLPKKDEPVAITKRNSFYDDEKPGESLPEKSGLFFGAGAYEAARRARESDEPCSRF